MYRCFACDTPAQNEHKCEEVPVRAITQPESDEPKINIASGEDVALEVS